MPVHYTDQVEHPPNLVIQGFTGSGMVASLALYHLFDLFSFKEIGYLTLEELPPVSLIKDGIAHHPIRIYASSMVGYAVICDIPLPDDTLNMVIDELVEWYKEKGIEEIIILGGLPTGREVIDDTIKVRIATNGFPLPFGDLEQIELAKKGGAYGTVALTLLRAKEERIPAICFLSECIPNLADYAATVSLLNEFSKFLNLEINTDDLMKNASLMKKKLMEKIPNLNNDPERISGSYT